MVFPIVMYGCESWMIKKAEHWRSDASDLWCWRTVLRVPWTARRSNQSLLKEISPEYSLKGLMLKLQYFGHLMRRADSLEKPLMLIGKIEGRRKRVWYRTRWLDAITNSMDMSERALGDGEGWDSWYAAVHGAAERQTWLNSRTTSREGKEQECFIFSFLEFSQEKYGSISLQ